MENKDLLAPNKSTLQSRIEKVRKHKEQFKLPLLQKYRLFLMIISCLVSEQLFFPTMVQAEMRNNYVGEVTLKRFIRRNIPSLFSDLGEGGQIYQEMTVTRANRLWQDREKICKNFSEIGVVEFAILLSRSKKPDATNDEEMVAEVTARLPLVVGMIGLVYLKCDPDINEEQAELLLNKLAFVDNPEVRRFKEFKYQECWFCGD